MEKRTLIAFVLSFLILLLWSMYYGSEPPQAPPEPGAPEMTSPGEAPPAPETAGKGPPETPGPETRPPAAGPEVAEQDIRVETPLYEALLSNRGPSLKSFRLKHYHLTTAADSPPIDLVSLDRSREPFLLFQFHNPGINAAEPVAFQVDQSEIRLSEGSGPRELVFESREANGLTVTQTFRFHPDLYRIDLVVQAKNESSNPMTGTFSADLRVLPPAEKQSYYAYVGFVLLANDSLEEIEIEKKAEEKSHEGKIQWLAYENEYFMTAVVPADPGKGLFRGRMKESGLLHGTYLPAQQTLNPLETAAASYTLYLGPRDLGILKALGLHLERAVDFGWTDLIAKPLLYTLRFFNQYLHNYGLSIILLTILVKLLFWPLTHKSYKSMKEMKKLQPRMAKIREKYKDNREQMNKETMALYRTYKVNPMGGCLPMVIQIPVFFALFRILGNAIELRHAPFLLWINDLSAPDRLFSFPFQIPFMTPPSGIPILTLLMGASMFIQQKMTPTPGDPTQAKIMLFLPVIFTFMFINFPSGLVLYWLVNNLLSIGQQYRIQKAPG